MKRVLVLLASLVFALPTAWAAPTQGKPHRATHLGNPATRFAPPLKTPEDLRRTLSSEALKEDVQTVARKTGYLGDMEDFFKAVETAPIKALSIPPNTLLPAMSRRKNGKADVLYNVLWAGKQPIDAYEFSFISGEKRYRVVTPKACTNFWVEEMQPPPKPELALNCEAPAQAPTGELMVLCCTLKNVGELTESQAILTLPFPAGTKVRCVSGGPDVSDPAQITWRYENLAPGAERTVCATFTPLQPGTVTFKASATAQRAADVADSQQTEFREP